MPTDFEQLLRDIFGDSLSRLSQFQRDQVGRLNSKLQELAREALKDELSKLHGEIALLRERVTALEAERAEKAADSV
jgi:predicted nuclease with TOPRIM domain